MAGIKGLICRSDDTGLGHQTRQLSRLIRPDKVMLIDSRPFRGPNTVQHNDWYQGFAGGSVNGFPSDIQVSSWLTGLTVAMTCETTYNSNFYQLARARGIKTINHTNSEFFDGWINPYQVPDVILLPSSWHEDEMRQAFPSAIVEVLPPPLYPEEYAEVRELNLNRTGIRRFVSPVGHLAVHDRAGTLQLLEALKYTKATFQLVIRSQDALPADYQTDDPRVTFAIGSLPNNADVYRDADAVLHMRRYGGLNLVMNDALMSGLPVIMPDCSPNDAVLPADWLVPAHVAGQFMTRRMIDLYAVDARALAAKFDEFCAMSDDELLAAKQRAYKLGYENYSPEVLKPRYLDLLG